MLDIMELYSKPASYKFSIEELSFIKKHLKEKRHKYRIRYAFYNKKSFKGKQIAFIIDSNYNGRKSGVENNWEYFSEREISNIEFQEIVENFGTNKRRFEVWYYKNIEALIEDDKKYNIDTPVEFIKECKKRNYSGNYQTLMNFEEYEAAL